MVVRSRVNSQILPGICKTDLPPANYLYSGVAAVPAACDQTQATRLPLQYQAELVAEKIYGNRPSAFCASALDFSIFVFPLIRAAQTNPDENVAFQHVKGAAKSVARPERFFTDSVHFFWWCRFFTFFTAAPARVGRTFFLVFVLLGLGFFFPKSTKSLLPKLARARPGDVTWIKLRHGHTD